MGREYLPRIEGINAKLDRAQEHLDGLQDSADPWIAKKETWGFPTQIDKGKRRYIISIRLVEPCPPPIAIVADEIVHHMRSALDHLACHLVETSGGQIERTSWPIEPSKRRWRANVERRQCPFQFWRKKGGGPLAGASPEARAFVERHQPYRRGGKAGDDPLVGLHDLWNTEKHRILNPIRLYAAEPLTFHDLFEAVPEMDPVEFKWLARPDDELKLNTDVLLALIRFPPDRPLPTLKMDGKLPAQVVMGDGKGRENRIQETLDLIRGIVSEAKALFPPR